MLNTLFPLLLELQLIGFTASWPVSNPKYQIRLHSTESALPEEDRDPAKSLRSSIKLPTQDTQEPVNHPIIIRVDYSNINQYAEDDTQSSWLDFITGTQHFSTPSLLYQQVWVCGEQTNNIKCHLKTVTPYEVRLEPYLTSVVLCRAIAVLIFSTSLMFSIVAMLWSR